MDLINIIPNGPFGTLITNKQFINFLTKTINFNYNLKQYNIFPAPQPVSIEKKDFEKLSKYDYNVSSKLDGTRFLLFFLKDKHNKNQNILINRALKFFSIIIEASDELYNGTLFDGELIFKDNTWKFIICDALQVCGNKINRIDYSLRLIEASNALSNIIYKDTSTIDIEVKKYYKFSEFNQFLEENYNRIPSDGIIFMPEKLSVKGGTQYSMLKWKPIDKHTFDFLIIENNDYLTAQVFHLNKLTDFAKIHHNNEVGNKFIEKIKSLDNYENKCIVECTFNKELNNFDPILIRTDKTHPNSLRTVERTLFNINENITIEDFKNIKFVQSDVTDEFEKVTID